MIIRWHVAYEFNSVLIKNADVNSMYGLPPFALFCTLIGILKTLAISISIIISAALSLSAVIVKTGANFVSSKL
jgi:hypothetical protein